MKQAAVSDLGGVPDKQMLGGLHVLAKRGQVVYDFARSAYRYRPIMPVALSEAVLGPESAEVTEGKVLASHVSVLREETLDRGRRFFAAKVRETSCEGMLDVDAAFTRAKCTCSFFFKTRLRAGPCRHLIALRAHVTKKAFSS